MAKNYSKKTSKLEIGIPKRETIDFILKYSRALQVMRVNNLKLTPLLN